MVSLAPSVNPASSLVLPLSLSRHQHPPLGVSGDPGGATLVVLSWDTSSLIGISLPFTLSSFSYSFSLAFPSSARFLSLASLSNPLSVLPNLGFSPLKPSLWNRTFSLLALFEWFLVCFSPGSFVALASVFFPQMTVLSLDHVPRMLPLHLGPAFGGALRPRRTLLAELVGEGFFVFPGSWPLRECFHLSFSIS